MPVLSDQTLRVVARAVLEATGTSSADAGLVADSLVESNLMGHDSHGVMRLPQYVNAVHNGQVLSAAQPLVSFRHGATAQVDGAWGWGQLAAQLATRTVIELARDYGVAAVTLVQANHIGRLGEYVELIARAGMVGIALCNAAPAVAPYGGRERIMGTNPIAWATPRGAGQDPLLLDFATAGVAEGKLRVARVKGETVADGLVVDSEGRPSREPAAFYEGGALLPFGGHKGYGLSVMVEAMARGLCGVGPGSWDKVRGANGTLIMALGIGSFVPEEQFSGPVDQLCAQISNSAPADGMNQILLPGEPEARSRVRRLAEGIPVPDQTWAEIQGLPGLIR